MTMPSYIINWEDVENEFDINKKIQLLGTIRDLHYNQKTMGTAISIPIAGGEYCVLEWEATQPSALIGITYSQSSYHPKDYWELWVEGDRIFETVYVKEIGMTKHWETIHYINTGQKVRLIHHNNSSTSKDIWVDLEVSGDGEFINRRS